MLVSKPPKGGTLTAAGVAPPGRAVFCRDRRLVAERNTVDALAQSWVPIRAAE